MIKYWGTKLDRVTVVVLEQHVFKAMAVVFSVLSHPPTLSIYGSGCGWNRNVKVKEKNQYLYQKTFAVFTDYLSGVLLS